MRRPSQGRTRARARRTPKQKGPQSRDCGPRKLSRRRPTFPHSYPCSIIGPARLNFRVRDGNGCDPRGMTTGKSVKSLRSRYQTSAIKKQTSKLFAAAQERAEDPPLRQLLTTISRLATSSARCRTVTVNNKTICDLSRSPAKPFVAEGAPEGVHPDRIDGLRKFYD